MRLLSISTLIKILDPNGFNRVAIQIACLIIFNFKANFFNNKK